MFLTFESFVAELPISLKKSGIKRERTNEREAEKQSENTQQIITTLVAKSSFSDVS